MKNPTKLPHINAIDHYQFVTFRTHDSLDTYLQKILEDTTLKTSIKQYQLDAHLDLSSAGSYFYNDALATMYDLLQSLDAELYELVCFCIMPNHVHILFRQTSSLESTMRRLKSQSAREMNRVLRREGKFWANGYYDKVIRDELHFKKVYEYIKHNPLKADLKTSERFYGVYKA
ncbi:MAG: transposase [Helicobacteraceae bacterium]|nr:transposase [Helicobacteraceae bacterium]